jgi:AcrR family transcriptional regulator
MNSDSDLRPETRLLKRAIDVIAHRGLDAHDVRMLVEEAQTSTSQFARYYRHKDALVAAVFDEGWLSIERHVSLRLFKPSTSIEELVSAVLEGTVDALEAEGASVSAALIIAYSSVGRNVPSDLKGTAAHLRFFQLVDQLRTQFKLRLLEDEALEALELLYGAALRRLVLATPLCKATSPPFRRELFIVTMQRIVASVVRAGATGTTKRG